MQSKYLFVCIIFSDKAFHKATQEDAEALRAVLLRQRQFQYSVLNMPSTKSLQMFKLIPE